MITALQGHFSSETPTRKGTVSVDCMQCLLAVKRWPKRKVFRSRRNISCDGTSRTAAGVTGKRIFSHFSAVTQETINMLLAQLQ